MFSMRKVAASTVTLIGFVGLAVLPAGAASAAASCDKGKDPKGNAVFFCYNKYGARIYPYLYSSNYVDHLFTTYSYFYCKTDKGPANGEVSPHPNRWVLTVGDEFGKSGWVSDADISSETNVITTCQDL